MENYWTSNKPINGLRHFVLVNETKEKGNISFLMVSVLDSEINLKTTYEELINSGNWQKGWINLLKHQSITEEYFMDGKTNQGGAVSNHRSWLSGNPGLTQEEAANITAARKSEACIEAIGSAKGTGRLVGTSVGAAAAPTVSTIPFVGWVVAGWVAMFGGDQGAEIGGNMAEDLNKNC